MKYQLLKWMLFFLCIILISIIFFHKDRLLPRNGNYRLHEDGFFICKSVLTDEQIENYRNLCKEGQYSFVKEQLLREPVLHKWKDMCTGPDYVYQDYIWIIQRSNVHTCHRDNNGDFFNETQKHPSYTLLIFLEKMDKCLGVIPQSHNDPYSNAVNLFDPVENIVCNPGDAILFNANLIHVGAMNDKEDNIRIQLKITHKDDLDAIAYYENFNKILNQPNTVPVGLRKIQKYASCMVPILSDWTQTENIRTSRGSDNGVDIGLPQQIFSYLFYGNKDFYNLPNAFYTGEDLKPHLWCGLNYSLV